MCTNLYFLRKMQKNYLLFLEFSFFIFFKKESKVAFKKIKKEGKTLNLS